MAVGVARIRRELGNSHVKLFLSSRSPSQNCASRTEAVGTSARARSCCGLKSWSNQRTFSFGRVDQQQVTDLQRPECGTATSWTSSPEMRQDSFADFEAQTTQAANKDDKYWATARQLMQYNALPAAESRTDPLDSCKEHRHRLPTTSQIARQMLCITATSESFQRMMTRTAAWAGYHSYLVSSDMLQDLQLLACCWASC